MFDNACQDALVKPAKIPSGKCLCVAGRDGQIGYALLPAASPLLLH